MSEPLKPGSRIVAAMSGGVDSSVTAALLKKQGYDVVGVTLQLYPEDKTPARKGACCAGADIYDAKRVAQSIGIPHYVLDYESRFRKNVIEDFADDGIRQQHLWGVQLAQTYYGSAPTRNYWVGCSTGGRHPRRPRSLPTR